MTTPAAPTFQILPLAKLHESKLNPRKSFPQASLEELAASIRTAGILQPLTVRPNGAGFEIGAGHRRYRAAKLAALTEVPCVVKPMTDVQFLELLVFENDHREDVHPLEEAEGYRSLMTQAKYTVDQIAERLGRSVKYVYDRVKLLRLVEPARTLFLEGKITAGHAILLARLTPDDQLRAIGDPRRHYDGGGVFTHETVLWSPDSPEYEQGRDEVKPRSVRELAGWIDEHVKFDHAAADPMLFPETVGTLKAAQEEAEKVVQITHEHYVQPEARDDKARIFGPSSWKRADGKHKTKTCERAVTGVIVAGAGRGEAYKVCIDKKGCRLHWATAQKESAARAKRMARGATASSEQDRWKRDEARRKAEEANRQAAEVRWKKALPQILEAVAARVKKAAARAQGLLGAILLEELAQESWRAERSPKKAAEYVPRGTTAEDLVRHAAFLILHGEACGYGAAADFPKRAKAFGLDVKAILDDVAPAQTSAEATPASPKKPRGKAA